VHELPAAVSRCSTDERIRARHRRADLISSPCSPVSVTVFFLGPNGGLADHDSRMIPRPCRPRWAPRPSHGRGGGGGVQQPGRSTGLVVGAVLEARTSPLKRKARNHLRVYAFGEIWRAAPGSKRCCRSSVSARVGERKAGGSLMGMKPGGCAGNQPAGRPSCILAGRAGLTPRPGRASPAADVPCSPRAVLAPVLVQPHPVRVDAVPGTSDHHSAVASHVQRAAGAPAPVAAGPPPPPPPPPRAGPPVGPGEADGRAA